MGCGCVCVCVCVCLFMVELHLRSQIFIWMFEAFYKCVRVDIVKHILWVISNHGVNHSKTWLKATTIWLSKILSWQSGLDSSGYIYCSRWHRPGSLMHLQSECRRGMAGPSRRVWDLLSVSRVLGLLDLSPKRPFSPLCVSSSLTLALTCSQSDRQHSKRVGRWDQCTKVTQHHFCHILFVKAGHRVSPHTRERDRPHFLTEGGGKNLVFLIHHEYRNLECSYNEDFNLKQLQRIKISSVWNKNESCIFPFQIQYVHLY